MPCLFGLVADRVTKKSCDLVYFVISIDIGSATTVLKRGNLRYENPNQSAI